MSYQVLARKYRPRSFDTLVGQEHVVRALTHALENKRLHHAYLFTGTRGVGKTTLSRILAKAFNCQGADGTGDVTAQPCGVCPACVAIDAGRFVDYIEMDAASNRGVDEMAQLLEQAVYSPSNARYKIYMIDEVHMLTAHAFNAMLKTLEEPPEYVKFVLATTDPQKIPVTVLSRCLQFNLKQMPPGHIVAHLENILAQEGIASEGPALRLLAQAAQGSMRDALSLTDQAIAYAAGTVTTEAVQGMLGALDQSYLVRLLDALAAGDGAGMLAVADEMAARSLSYAVALQDLGSLLQRMALAQAVPEALPGDLPEYDDIVRLAQAFDPEDVQLYYQIAVHGRNELGLAPDEYAGFSMALLRMLAFRPGAASAPARPAPAAAPAAPRVSAAPVSAPTSAPASAPTLAPISTPPRSGPSRPGQAALEAARNAANRALGQGAAQKKTEADTSVATSVPAAIAESGWADPGAAAWAATESAAVSQTVREPMFETAPAPKPAPAPAASAPVRPSAAELRSLDLDWDGDWPELARRLPLRGVVQQLAQQSEFQGCERTGATLELRLKVALETLCSAGSVDKLAAALGEHFGRQVRIVTEVGAVAHTAYARIQAEEALRLQQAEQTVHGDPFVQTMMREFGAIVVPGSIKPI